MSLSFKVITCNSTEISEMVVDLPINLRYVDLPINLRYVENSTSIPVPAARAASILLNILSN